VIQKGQDELKPFTPRPPAQEMAASTSS
jgi:hypothetical protein